jgi:restriction endonuclease S subunit
LIKIFGAKEPTLKLIYYYVLTHNLDVFQKSAAISFLSSESFKNIKISLPELSKRNEVLDEINHLFKKKELIDKELEKIENLLYESKASLIYETIE